MSSLLRFSCGIRLDKYPQETSRVFVVVAPAVVSDQPHVDIDIRRIIETRYRLILFSCKIFPHVHILRLHNIACKPWSIKGIRKLSDPRHSVDSVLQSVRFIIKPIYIDWQNTFFFARDNTLIRHGSFPHPLAKPFPGANTSRLHEPL